MTLGAHRLGHETVVKPLWKSHKEVKVTLDNSAVASISTVAELLSCCMTRCSKTKKGIIYIFRTAFTQFDVLIRQQQIQICYKLHTDENFGYKTYKVRSSIGQLLSFDPVIKPVTNNLPSSYGVF